MKKTVTDAMNVYHDLSYPDRLTFYTYLTNSVNTDHDTAESFLTETRHSEEKVCMHCGSTHIVKNGHRKDGTQRFLCRDCKKSFLINTNSIISGTRKRLGVWMKYMDCMKDKRSLRKSAEICQISVGTAFIWRHKILDVLVEFQNKVCLDGTVEADETFFDVSYKGNHSKSRNFEMPREAHKRGSSVHTKGLSSEKVCVVCAVNDSGNALAQIGKLGKVSTDCINKVLGNRIHTDAVLCTDQENAYIRYARDKALKLVQMDTDCRVNGEYNIQRINAYHSNLKGFIRHFNGVSTKYLNNYLVWYDLMFCGKQDMEDRAGFLLGYALSAHRQIRCLDVPHREAVPCASS